MSETISSLNGTLWVFAAILIGLVVVQALVFLRLALKFNKKNNLATESELKSAFRTGAVSVFGPAISSSIVALSLIGVLGSGIAFMRCGVIGAPPWELFMAELSAQTVGVEFNTPEFTPAVLTLCLFGMIFGSAPYFVSAFILYKPLDSLVNKAKQASAEGQKKESFVPVMGNAAMVGMLGYMIPSYLTSVGPAVALILSGVITYFVIRAITQKGFTKLRDWTMPLAMVSGMAVAQIVVTYMG